MKEWEKWGGKGFLKKLKTRLAQGRWGSRPAMLPYQELPPTWLKLIGAGEMDALPAQRRSVLAQRRPRGARALAPGSRNPNFSIKIQRNTPQTYTNACEMILYSQGQGPMVYLPHIASHKRGEWMRHALIWLDVTSTVANRALVRITYHNTWHTNGG